MATEQNAAFTTVTWNSVTLEVLSSTLPNITRTGSVDNTHTGTGAIAAKSLGARGEVGEASIVAKFDNATYISLFGMVGQADQASVVTSSMVWTLDSLAPVTVSNMGLTDVTHDGFEIDGQPTMTLTFEQNAPTGGTAPTSGA